MQWRASQRRARTRLSAVDLRQAAQNLPAALAEAVAALPVGAALAAYVGVGTEPSTDALLSAWRGRTVLLPVLLPGGDLDWAEHDGRFVAGRHGLREPAGPRKGRDALATCALVVVPALAVDRSGTRLGRGGGSYDRALTRTRALVVAALHVGELIDGALPREAHDRPVDAVVLPGAGLVRLHAGVGRGMSD